MRKGSPNSASMAQTWEYLQANPAHGAPVPAQTDARERVTLSPQQVKGARRSAAMGGRSRPICTLSRIFPATNRKPKVGGLATAVLGRFSMSVNA